MAERLGTGLQNLLQRFDSARHLQKTPFSDPERGFAILDITIIVADLRDRGYDAELLVEEDDDVPLAERYRRANTYSQALGKENVILVSIHANAFGNGREWAKARGWSVYTGKGQTRADLLADDLARVAMKDLGSKAVCGVWQNSDIDYLDR